MISREMFLKVINYIKHVDDLTVKFNDVLDLMGNGEGYCFPYDESISMIQELLADYMELDNYLIDTLSWWLWDTDFGQKICDDGRKAATIYEYRDGKQEKTIILDTADLLYDYLVREVDRRKKKEE